MDKKWINAIGLLATFITFGASFATNWVSDKKMEEKINEGIKEALAKSKES